jgi:hypothetical protein
VDGSKTLKFLYYKILETYMSWVVVIGQSMHFLQAWKIYVTKSAEDFSAIAYNISDIPLQIKIF